MMKKIGIGCGGLFVLLVLIEIVVFFSGGGNQMTSSFNSGLNEGQKAVSGGGASTPSVTATALAVTTPTVEPTATAPAATGPEIGLTKDSGDYKIMVNSFRR